MSCPLFPFPGLGCQGLLLVACVLPGESGQPRPFQFPAPHGHTMTVPSPAVNSTRSFQVSPARNCHRGLRHSSIASLSPYLDDSVDVGVRTRVDNKYSLVRTDCSFLDVKLQTGRSGPCSRNSRALPLVFRESVGVSLVLHIYDCCAVLDYDRVTLRYGVHVHVQLPMTAHGWHDALRRWPCLNMHIYSLDMQHMR